MTRRLTFFPLATLFAATTLFAQSDDVRGMKQLRDAGAEVSVHPATGVPRFLSFRTAGGYLPEPAAATAKRQASSFLARFSTVFGIADPADLTEVSSTTDAVGQTHLTYAQSFRGVPVFAGLLRLHFDDAGRVLTVNGTAIPDIELDITPSIDRELAQRLARRAAFKESGNVSRSTAGEAKLYVYRTGLARGVEGKNHLSWEIEVSDGPGARFLVYVDAHSGQVLEMIDVIREAVPNRRLYEFLPLESSLVWTEGDPFPTGKADHDQLIATAGDTFNFFSKAFGRDSYDGANALMRSVYEDERIDCPNATWNGTTTNFCAGTSADDVIAHEWTHAYTQFTHGLIYLWQPGALNEAYSDIFAETIDLLNNGGDGFPVGVRSAELCSVFIDQRPRLSVESPQPIAKDYAAYGADFGPRLSVNGVRGEFVLVDDGVIDPDEGSRLDGCEGSFLTDVRGKIAVIQRGLCTFTEKVKNAQLKGAIAVVITNDQRRGESIFTMGGEDNSLSIPAMFVSYATGVTLTQNVSSPVIATLRLGSSKTETNARWLIGESANAFGGAIRDMWNPGCFSKAARVLGANYFCSNSDNGGVHQNSSIPNHLYALLVDGGSLNGQVIEPIGLTRAAHIYYRAMSTYQVPASDFADHADAVETSCTDLIGQNLASLTTGEASGEVITTANCNSVRAAMLAGDMRSKPACNFAPLLGQSPPAQCAGRTVFHETFENGLGAFTASSAGVDPSWTRRDWIATSQIPAGHSGSAAFAVEAASADCEVNDESGVMHLESREIVLPSESFPSLLLSFRHFVATEFAWDGGNVKMRVNDGDWFVIPRTAFVYNHYNLKLLSDIRGSTNPLRGEDSFSGVDDGSLSGSWGESQIDLAGLAAPGDKIRLRFDFGVDRCVAKEGWYVDDVKITACGLREQRRRPVKP